MLLRCLSQGAVDDIRTPIPMRIMRVEVITRENPFHQVTAQIPTVQSEPYMIGSPKRAAYKKAATAPTMASIAAPVWAAAPVNWEGAGLVLLGAPVAAG
jgi:hypothetical protein